MSTILTKALAVALVSILMVVMVAPQPAYAQGGLLSGITGILSALNGATAALQNFIDNVMRPILQSISAASSAVQNILSTLRNFFEQVVWPSRRNQPDSRARSTTDRSVLGRAQHSVRHQCKSAPNFPIRANSKPSCGTGVPETWPRSGPLSSRPMEPFPPPQTRIHRNGT